MGMLVFLSVGEDGRQSFNAAKQTDFWLLIAVLFFEM